MMNKCEYIIPVFHISLLFIIILLLLAYVAKKMLFKVKDVQQMLSTTKYCDGKK